MRWPKSTLGTQRATLKMDETHDDNDDDHDDCGDDDDHDYDTWGPLYPHKWMSFWRNSKRGGGHFQSKNFFSDSSQIKPEILVKNFRKKIAIYFP